jgi:hypothetical protein
VGDGTDVVMWVYSGCRALGHPLNRLYHHYLITYAFFLLMSTADRDELAVGYG